MRFFVGLHEPAHARHFERCCISVNRLRRRKSPFPVGEWMIDSGAFTEISTHGRYRHGVEEYARDLKPWLELGDLQAVVAQDFMCEPWIIEKTGLSIKEHQTRTVHRYDQLKEALPDAPIMAVLQGYAPEDYRRHLEMYGARLELGDWCGVGSVCKRNGSPEDVLAVLVAINHARPDLRLHGFGVKLTSLQNSQIKALLHSADSMAWSLHARMNGRNGNDWREAAAYCRKVEETRPSALAIQMPLCFDLP